MNKENQTTYPSMKEITYRDYLEFLKKNDSVIIEDQEVKFHK